MHIGRCRDLNKEVIIKIIGAAKWSNGHLHDGRVYQIFLTNMVQFFGRKSWDTYWLIA